MHKTEPLTVTGNAVLGSAPLVVAFDPAQVFARLEADLGEDTTQIRPLAPIEFEIYATKILQELVATRLEIADLRHDLHERTWARRWTRFGHWLASFFTRTEGS